MTETKLLPQAMDDTTRLSSKILFTTRSYASASGDVSYTGIGFKPTSIRCDAFSSDTVDIVCHGFSDSAKGNLFVIKDYDGVHRGPATFGNFLIVARYNGSTMQQAIVKSYDADGFTLTWTKTGSPTGTIYLNFICYR